MANCWHALAVLILRMRKELWFQHSALVFTGLPTDTSNTKYTVHINNKKMPIVWASISKIVNFFALLTFLFLFGGVSRRILNCHLLTEAGVKSEDKENKAASSKDTRSLSLLHDVPALHLAAVRQRHDRANLLKNVGPFRRGLCARRDLEIRRQLCKVDKVGCNCVPAFLKF